MLAHTTNNMINMIVSTIFVPEYRRLGTWVDRLCRQNREAHQDPELVAFIYNGDIYKPVATDMANHLIKRRGLHSSLGEDMEMYLRDLSLLTQDKSFIAQSLFKLLDPCENDQDVRDTLPNCLADTLPQLQGISRHREPAWTIVEDERAMRQYNKVLPKIEMYSAARLMY